MKPIVNQNLLLINNQDAWNASVKVFFSKPNSIIAIFKTNDTGIKNIPNINNKIKIFFVI